MCNISAQSALASLLKKTQLIIWDECLMSHRHQIECVDRTMQDLLECNKPFGGKCVVFGGDPRQILPVIKHGTRAAIVDASITSSPLWPKFQKRNLTVNMRADEDEIHFSEYLLRIGNGTENIAEDANTVRVPANFRVSTMEGLIDHVFPDVEQAVQHSSFISNRAILTPRNENVHAINDLIMNRLPGESHTYLSADSVEESEEPHLWPTDFLNSLSPSGMPPHSLTLKVGAPVMLLRNLKPGAGHGLSNGTRMVVKQLGRNIIEIEILTGSGAGQRVMIPRITLAPSEMSIPFRRRQFPVQSCFAISVNKAQGQTLEHVGIYLPEPVFSHGQYYVALSRAKRASAVAVYVPDSSEHTSNIVYSEVLSMT